MTEQDIAKAIQLANKFAPIEWTYCPLCGEKLSSRREEHRDRPHCDRCQRHYYSNPTPAACCFVTRGEDLLLGKRGVDPQRGEWALPGGYIELGETAAETALRELHEETGLRGGNPRLIGVSSQQHPMTGSVLVIGFIIETWEGELCAGSDVEALRFFPKAEVPRLPFRAHRDLYAIFEAVRSGAVLPETRETQPAWQTGGWHG